jgi:signal transduction histidine kinase/DNA-binding response OmpR family regulator
LAPGTYKLEVKVLEHAHNENNPISTLTIYIQPPLWLSVPAYVFYVISAIVVLFIFVKRTKRKHLELLKQQKREFEIAQRQEMDEAKLRFYTNISHDLRTPLTLIISPLEKLLQENIVTPQIKNELELMFRNSHLLLDVVNQLLDLRRIEKGKVKLNLSYGNLSEFICDICSSFEPYEKNRNIQLILDIQENELETDFDRNMMLRIMMNLLSNAFKYNIDNGKVIVSIQRIVNENNQEFANIIVSDTGIGIKDENKKKVFERYYQEKQSYETTYASSGIGMHIVKEYVALHDGTIRIEDNQPHGTKFVITIPIKSSLKNDHTQLSNTPLIIPENVTDMQVSILIVEDNDDFRHFLSNYLSNYFQTFEASNGEQALDILENNEINLAICDVRMPSMSGLELCNRIKTNIQFSHIPVILLTARINEEHIIEGLQEGADEYITKPVNLSYLLLRINKLLEWTKDNHKKFEQESIIPNEVTISQLDNQLITRVIEYININMDNSEFSVEELSEKVGLSRGHLYKKLTSIVGKSPQEFIRIMRIRKGKELLDENVDNISQIAYQIGLSPKLFAKYFKDEYGCSPSTYLKKKNENIEL